MADSFYAPSPERSGALSVTPPQTGQGLEVYHGKGVSAEATQGLRDRLHWIVSQAQGESILDVGTGAGIVPVLLARDGFKAVGIDIDPVAIEMAEQALAQEPEPVRERVRFLNVSVFQEPSDLVFDTVILGDILQHVGNVRNVMRLAVSHLSPEGILIVTVPFGTSATGEAKHSFHLSGMLEHLAPLGKVQQMSIEGGHIRIVLVAGQAVHAAAESSVAEAVALRATEAVLVQMQSDLVRQRLQLADLGAQNARLQGQMRATDVRHDALAEEIKETVQELVSARSDRQKAQSELRAAMARLQEIEQDRGAEQNTLRSQSADLRATKAQLELMQAGHGGLQDRVAELTAQGAGAQEARDQAQAALKETKAQLKLLQTEHDVLQDRETELTVGHEALAVARDAAQAALKEAEVLLARETGLLHSARRDCDVLEAEVGALDAEMAELRRTYSRHSLDVLNVAGRDLSGTGVAGRGPDAEGHDADAIELISALREHVALPVAQMLQVCEDVAYEHEGIAQHKVQMAQRVAQVLDPSPARTRALGLSLLEDGQIAAAARLLGGMDLRDARSSGEARLWTRLAAWLAAGSDVAAWHADVRPLTRSALRVATVMDEFTYHSYAPECDLMQLSVGDWEAELEAFDPEMLFIESAWRGKDEAWGAKVGHLGDELRGILAWARVRGIPCIFWNKEDPVHFETFLNTAAQFDAVFTTDLDRVAAYKEALGHDRIYFLPFAAQPEIHNPVEIYARKDAFCFAGAYYKRYPHRTKDLETFVETLPDYRPLEIYDRNFGKDHPDYMFPDSYRPYIVGTLAPTEIGRAYKGYRFGINLNSIKDSQTMFARRVYELLASNTVTVSNFSRGVRQMFGDLVISTDSGRQALARIRQIDMRMGGRFRLAGLRKVLSEHTYSHRMSYITEKVGLPVNTDTLAPVVVLAQAETPQMAQGLVAQFARQTWAAATLVLVVPDLEEFAEFSDARIILRKASDDASIADVVPQGARIAGMVAQDYYGPNYLTDLILSTRYADAPVIGKAACHAVRAGMVVVEQEGAAYGTVPALPCRASLIVQALLADIPLVQWLDGLEQAQITDAGCFAIDPYNYCRDGLEAGAPALMDVQTVVDDVVLDQGLALSQAQAVAEQTPARGRKDTGLPSLTGADLSAGMVPPQGAKLTWELGGADWIVTSYLPSETHTYLYQSIDHLPADMMPDGTLKLHLKVTPGLNLYWVVLFLDENRQKISHQMVVANRDATFDLPEGTAWLRFGLRVYGPGHGAIKRLILGHQAPQPVRLLETRKHLVLTNHYPSHEDLYRNGFVHSRVKAYRAQGMEVDVLRLRPRVPTQFDEFAGVDVVTGGAEQLDDMLTHGSYESVNVHFLDADMWEVLARHIPRIRVNVWVHGSEVQPWWRREYNYVDDPAGLEVAKAQSDVRLAFWRDVLTPMPANLHLVFVSEYLRSIVMEDLELSCPDSQCSVIHNPIDTDLFRYREKTAEQRLNILSIRPFASATYANDLTIEAIRLLAKKSFFKKLRFHLIGQGVLYNTLTAGLEVFPNVTLHNHFLPQQKIPDYHHENGIFLCPSRMDTQGVSRDEAMSSGLVPVTTCHIP